MKTPLLYALLAVATATAAMAQTPAATTAAPMTATANLIDVEGRPVGEARLQQTPRGVLVRLELRNATPGAHAVHLHQVGKCERPSFESAGPHVAAPSQKHGFLNASGPHTGDLPNIDIPSTRSLVVEQLVPGVTLDGSATSLLDADGSAIVLHSGKDDYSSDPAGNSGDRIACGPIAR